MAAASAYQLPLGLAKVKIWVNGDENESIVALTADFGSILLAHDEQAHRFPTVSLEPLTGCSSNSSKLLGFIALVRGDCIFTTKAKVAQDAGATVLVVLNDDEGFVQMGCGNETSLNITIPVITISKTGEEELKNYLDGGAKVELLLYSTNRPILDYSVIFLWMMCLGTIVTASFWPDITGSEDNDERYNELSPKVDAKLVIVANLGIHSRLILRSGVAGLSLDRPGYFPEICHQF
ncbi:signal peptide peptidase-like 2 [Phtheirospermum japonicum]|uniref:Signal peptide peptidase-like 2 n=1 Tax=Phtheirospermum japonicum TaxID=374723 RepID=A0A830DIY3_9LAMI|nr:signal peptide peptidase-like 2 [Phtheirospermum japonicum]